MNVIEERLKSIIEKDEFIAIGFLSKYFGITPFRGDIVSDMLVRRLIDADIDTKKAFIDIMEQYTNKDIPIRVCSECGKWIVEGYYLGGVYACCDECAVQLYIKAGVDEKEAEKVMRSELENDEKYCLGETYWTEWE